MKYEAHTLKLLHALGFHKMYKGCEYIISSINYISKNETYFTPVTKVLYVEIAKQYNTSSICVEKNIRSIIRKIWADPENEELICKIFGKHNLNKSPSNVEFLMLLYNYLKHRRNTKTSKETIDYTFICPLSGSPCEFCKEFIVETINNLNKD